MRLQSVGFGDAVIVTVEGQRIDAAGAIKFKEDFRALVKGTTSRVILDMTRVTFVDSSGLGAIVACMKELGGRKLELAGLHGAPEKVFRLTRMDTVFRIHSSRGAAEATLAQAS